MTTKKYDEIAKQPLDSLAQTISDMTYCYNETRVPKYHYKGMMNEIIEQEISHQVTMGILNTHVSTLKQMKEDSPKLFIQALICMEENIKLKTGVYENQSFPISFFKNKLFKNCTFESCYIYKENEMSRIEYATDFKNCIFTNFNFSNVIYYKISFDECVFEKLILHGQFTHCCFAGSTFNECEINENSSFNYCNFSMVDVGSLNFDVLEDNQADKLFVGLANFVESEANLEEKNNSSAIANQDQIEAIKFIL